MIRESAKYKILNALNYDIFRYEEFEVKETIEDNEYIIQIKYEKFFFEIKFEGNTDIIMHYGPGALLLEDYEKIDFMYGFEGKIHRSIIAWLDRVKEDIFSPVKVRFFNSALEAFKADLEQRINNVEDSLFSRNEQNELYAWLNDLEEKISQEKDETYALKEEIQKMKEEIEFLKNILPQTTKKTWVKRFLLKVWTWSQEPENKALIEAGMETVKRIANVN